MKLWTKTFYIVKFRNSGFVALRETLKDSMVELGWLDARRMKDNEVVSQIQKVTDWSERETIIQLDALHVQIW